MTDAPNPYQSPLSDPAADTQYLPCEAGPQGNPGPIVLAWLGVLTAGGVIFSIFAAQAGAIALLGALIVPPVRIVWVIYANRQRRLFARHWPSGSRLFLQVVWVINVILLIIDSAFILFLGTCLVLIATGTF